MTSIAAKDALACLTIKQAEAVILRCEGYTYREIAGELCIAVGSAWRRIDRAKERISET